MDQYGLSKPLGLPVLIKEFCHVWFTLSMRFCFRTLLQCNESAFRICGWLG
ncbi:hypothetical protein DAI22_10g096200 [Oryza sativa Japonica Group]|nr:hypothetical protein DAI22_10g096200 [Oryza sativa Japonica Group]